MDEPEELNRFKRELELFRSADENLARAAFDRLVGPSRRYMYALLRDRLSRDDLDEIVQTALMKAWQNRDTFVNQGRAAWYGWLKRIAHNTYIDRLRTRRPDISIDALAEREDEELPLIERCMTTALGKEFYYLADVVMLGLDESLTPSEQDRRLLAAQYYYLDDWSVDELLALLSETRPESPPVSHAQLDAWLENPGTLRYLAYRELYFSPERLTICLLGLRETATADDLDRALTTMRAETDLKKGLGGWTCPETQAILWRYYRGLNVEEIGHLIKNIATIDSIDALFVRCRQRFPFVTQMKKICAWLDDLDFIGVERQTLLGSKSGIWYRLAFEYRYRHSLPHRDIHERVHPAANLVQYEITLEMLCSWLSGGRLLDRVRRYHEQRQSGQDHG